MSLNSEEKKVKAILKRDLKVQNAQPHILSQFPDYGARLFGTVENLDTFRKTLDRLFEWDSVPVVPLKDRFAIYPQEILAGMQWSQVTREDLPYAPFLAASYIAHSENGDGETVYRTEDWRRLLTNLRSIPLSYLERSFFDDDEIMPVTLARMVEAHRAGVSAKYFRKLPIQNKLFPGSLGFELEEALRLQQEKVNPRYASIILYHYRDSSEKAAKWAIRLKKAGVPFIYASALLRAGLTAREVREAHASELPEEYAVAMGSGRLKG